MTTVRLSNRQYRGFNVTTYASEYDTTYTVINANEIVDVVDSESPTIINAYIDSLFPVFTVPAYDFDALPDLFPYSPLTEAAR